MVASQIFTLKTRDQNPQALPILGASARGLSHLTLTQIFRRFESFSACGGSSGEQVSLIRTHRRGRYAQPLPITLR